MKRKNNIRVLSQEEIQYVSGCSATDYSGYSLLISLVTIGFAVYNLVHEKCQPPSVFCGKCCYCDCSCW